MRITSDEIFDASGEIAFPSTDAPISFYVPPDGTTGTVHGPRYVEDRIQIAEAVHLDRDLDSDEELRQYFAPLIERFEKSGP